MITDLHPWWGKAWSDLCSHWSRHGYQSLTDDQKVWLNLRSLIDNTENGGLISFYYNSGADNLQDTMTGLERLGAMNIRLQVERVNSLFGAHVPNTLDARNDVINSWHNNSSIENMLHEIDQCLMPMFAELEAQLEAFVRDRRLARDAGATN